MADTKISEPVQTEDKNDKGNIIPLVSDLLLPGASLLLKGNIAEGVAHVALGTAATIFLGPFGRLLISAQSFSRSTTNKHLHEHIGAAISDKAEQ